MEDYDIIVDYAKQIGIAFTRGDIEEILAEARENNTTDLRYAVWDFLDWNEGISHTRDLEFWPNGDDDEDNSIL